QAEDGIRDLTVTGVQTCALPICFQSNVVRLRTDSKPAGPADIGRKRHRPAFAVGVDWRVRYFGERLLQILEQRRMMLRENRQYRSEERRVGKESRYREERST